MKTQKEFIEKYNQYLASINQGKFIGKNPFQGCGVVPGFYHWMGFKQNGELEKLFYSLPE